MTAIVAADESAARGPGALKSLVGECIGAGKEVQGGRDDLPWDNSIIREIDQKVVSQAARSSQVGFFASATVH